MSNYTSKFYCPDCLEITEHEQDYDADRTRRCLTCFLETWFEVDEGKEHLIAETYFSNTALPEAGNVHKKEARMLDFPHYEEDEPEIDLTNYHWTPKKPEDEEAEDYSDYIG